MYSGTTLTRFSGRVLGAHQKIDRVARKHLSKLISDNSLFPAAKEILNFEGKNGPDGIKRKSPARDEPWHYFDPFDDTDKQLTEIIEQHYNALVKELKAKNNEKVAFEAAWLAHALVDGLTPAHHFPYEEKLIELRGGKPIESRTTIKEKLVMHGDTRREKIKNNWQMWGPKGLLTTHGLFEIGIATLMLPARFTDVTPTTEERQEAAELGIVEIFKRYAREIAVLDMYERYYQHGWTPKLAYDVRHKLGPLIIKAVTLAWYSALIDAKLASEKTHENSQRKARRKNDRKS